MGTTQRERLEKLRHDLIELDLDVHGLYALGWFGEALKDKLDRIISEELGRVVRGLGGAIAVARPGDMRQTLTEVVTSVAQPITFTEGDALKLVPTEPPSKKRTPAQAAVVRAAKASAMPRSEVAERLAKRQT